MARRPSVVAFDVVETLFSLEPLRPRLVALGLPASAVDLWYTRLLRDGMALSAACSYTSFSQVAAAALDLLVAQHGVEATPEQLEHVMAGFKELPPHPDVLPALEALSAGGVRIVALTNGGADTTRILMERAGAAAHFERIISIDEVRTWKPSPQVYLHAAALCKTAPTDMAMVAVHSWDLHGARQAGLTTGWASRLERRWPSSMKRPDVAGDTLDEVTKGLLAL